MKYLLLALAIGLSGCETTNSPVISENCLPGTGNPISGWLPHGAVVEKNLGHCWYIVKLQPLGENQESKRILTHLWSGSHGEQGCSFIELKE